MPKISWNDINDSDSSLSSDHEDPHQNQPIGKKTSAETGVSSKVQIEGSSRLKTACDELSLAKLNKHQKQQVWLYVLNSFHERADEVTLLLESSSLFSRVMRMKGVGWNVETTLERARKLIVEGFKHESIAIKFIYSNRNEDRSVEDKQKYAKMQKKVTYIEKTNQLPILEKFLSQVTPKKGISFEEDGSSTKKGRQDKGRQQRPKVKWVEKQKGLQIQDLKQPQFNVRMQSPRTFANLKQSKSPKRYKQKAQTNLSAMTTPTKTKQNIDEPSIKKALTPNTKTQKYFENVESNPRVQKTIREKPQIQKQKEQIRDCIDDADARVSVGEVRDNAVQTTGIIEGKIVNEGQIQSDEQSSEGQRQERKKKKNRKKKNRGGKLQVKGQKKDCNNPYSFFACP